MVKVQKPLPKTFGMKIALVDSNKKKRNGKKHENGDAIVTEKVKHVDKTTRKTINLPTKLSKESGKKGKKVEKIATSSQELQNTEKKVEKKKESQQKGENKSVKIGKILKSKLQNQKSQKFVKKQKLEKIAKALKEDVKLPSVQPKPEPAPEEKKSKTEIDNKSATKNLSLKQKDYNKKNKTNAITEPKPFDEKQFNKIVNVDKIEELVESFKNLVEKEVKSKKKIFSDYRYMLDVVSFKISNCPKRIVKLNLKHSIVDKDDDVVIIVPDLYRGSKVDFEPTIQHYEDLFREAGIEGLKIMPFNQLRKECNTFEAVRKFSNTYDYFLCDGRIVGHVTGFCGKIFQKPRKTFHAVRMDKNIKNEITKSLHRTAYRQLEKGNLTSIPVANHKHSTREVAENVHMVVDQLKTIYAGGLENIRSMHLKIDIFGTSSLPIYVSLGNPPPETPNVIGPREKRMHKLKKEANAVLSRFSINKDAEIINLTPQQIERKRQIKEARDKLIIESTAKSDIEEPQDNDGDESIVPAKKARKDKDESSIEHDVKKKDVEEGEGVSDDDSEGSVGEGDSDDDNDNASDDDDDDDDGNDDNDEDVDEEEEVDEDDDDGEGDDDDFDDEDGNKDDDDDDDDDDEEDV